MLPKIFYVNWFRKDLETGSFLWPGFGENSRVLEWVFRRCDDAAEARDTPIGRVPTPDALNTDGLDIPDDELEEHPRRRRGGVEAGAPADPGVLRRVRRPSARRGGGAARRAGGALESRREMTAGASLLDLIGERTSSERAPAVRAFAEAFLRRLSADGGADGTAAEALCGRDRRRRSSSPRRAAREPIAVRAFNPTLEEHGYEPPGSVRGDQHRGPAVPGRLGQRRAARRAGSAVHRVLHPIVGDRARRRRARSTRSCTRARRRGASRSCTSSSTAGSPTSELDELEDALRGVLADVRATGARLPGHGRPRAADGRSSRGAGAARYADDEVDETVAFLEWLLHDNFIFLGYREYRFTRRRDRGRARLRARDPRRRRATRPSRSRVPIESLPPEACASARSRATC